MADREFVLIGENTLEVAFVMEVNREMNEHNKLYGRFLPDQHNIGSITGLQDALDANSSAIAAEKERAEGVEGSLSNLATDSKTNIVSAINEVDLHADNNATNLSNHINNKSNPHEVTKAQVDLGNVDNTADMDKPVSTATQTALDNITNGTTSIAYDNTTSGLSATTLQGAIDEIDGDLDNVEDLIPSAASSSNQLADKSYVDTADNNLQSQIDAISASSDVTDIVDTYAELQAYDTSTLTNDDIIKVLKDESQGGATTYYRWVVSGSSGSFVLIGAEGPYYTKAEADELLGEKQNKIDNTHKLDSDLVNDSGQTNKFVTASEKAQISTNASEITALQSGKADKSTTYTKTEVDTIASGKANVGLDNLNADGQMIIDSQNGTISNCILEIPQNLKLTLENNVLTLKAGSVLTKTGSTYETITISSDLVRSGTFTPNRRNLVFTTNGTGFGINRIERTGSGSSLPADNSQYDWFFNTTDKKMYWWGDGGFSVNNLTYPICVVDVDSQGNVSFAKDSNGNDMIFNGGCFVGHHIVAYPNPNAGLYGDGFNTDDSLKSGKAYISSLTIVEITSASSTRVAGFFGDGSFSTTANGYEEVEDFPNSPITSKRYYVKNKNAVYQYYSSSWHKSNYVNFINLVSTSSGGEISITDFTIRQPYEGARNLLTDDIEAEVATKQVDVTTLTGYDSTQTQTLKNINGVLTWVTD